MNNKKVVIAGVALAAVVLIWTGIIAIVIFDNVYASSKHKGTSAQQNSCGNDDLTINIVCQNFDSKSHGRDNAEVLNSTAPSMK